MPPLGQWANRFVSGTLRLSPGCENLVLVETVQTLQSTVGGSAHLAGWHDCGEGIGLKASHEGQGRELISLVTI